MVVQPVSGSSSSQAQLKAEEAREQEFLQVLKELDAYIEAQKKTPEEKRREEQIEQEKKAKAKKMADLQMRIATLRSRINLGFENAEGELAMLQSQLFHLQIFG